jgi:hypothetical protein
VYNIDQKDKGTLEDRGRDGGTNFILRTKEQETHLTLHERDDDDYYYYDDNDDDDKIVTNNLKVILKVPEGTIYVELLITLEGHVVTQLVQELRYESEGGEFNSR